MRTADCILYIAKIKEADYERIYSESGTAFEQRRIERIEKASNPTVRNSLIATGMLLNHVFTDFGIDVNDIAYSDNGKPYIRTRDDLFINISHSGEYIAVAVSGREVGVDIQKKVTYHDKLAHRIMADDEYSEWADRIETEFHYLWAVKESFSKLTGTGIATDFKKVSFAEHGNGITYYVDGEIAGYGVSLKDIPEYALTVCGYDSFTLSNVEYVDIY